MYKAIVELQRSIICGSGCAYADAKSSCGMPYFQVPTLFAAARNVGSTIEK